MKTLPRPRCGSAIRRGYDRRPENATVRFPIRAGGASVGNSPADPEARSIGVARLEAALFLGEESLTIRRLMEVAGLKDATETRGLLSQLREHLHSTASAFRIEEIAGGYQLLTTAACQLWLGRLRKPEHMARLTPALTDTLAILAYKQPMTKADLDAVRGVDCGEMLRLLIERGLVRTMGRQDSLGRPPLYGTAKRFLQVFGFKTLAELPATGA